MKEKCKLCGRFYQNIEWLLTKSIRGFDLDQETIDFRGKMYDLDRHGFLDPSDQWDINFAEGMAEKLGILEGLSEEHWSFINYLRMKYIDEKTVPVVVKACSDNNLRLTKLRSLFPTGYHRGACKIAGLNFNSMCEINIWLSYETPPKEDAEYNINELKLCSIYR